MAGYIKKGDEFILSPYIGDNPVWAAYVGTGSVSPDIRYSTYISASGGTITTSGSYKIHTFTTTGTSSFDILSVPLNPLNGYLDVLVVAGGGAGYYPDGGGAGGVVYITGSVLLAKTGSQQVIVGAGGIADKTFPYDYSTSGSNSVLSGSTAVLTAIGGGSGNPFNFADRNGGSGGGASKDPALQPLQSGLSGQYGYGFAGYTGSLSAGQSGYGAGGATQYGQRDNNLLKGGDGGDGITTVFGIFGGGGGGAGGDAPGNLNTLPGIGGTGGGGNGSYRPGTTGEPAQDGTPNTGGGGGGAVGYYAPETAGNGGSGVVIIRYKYKD